MGRHKDPDILKFIEYLKNKGKSLGFNTKDEFSLIGGIYFVDLIWTPYENKHQMFITFEIEKKDDNTLKNLDKIIDTNSSEVEKPFRHFVITFDEVLKKGTKKIVNEKIRKYNISLYENLKNNKKLREDLDKELENLKIEISKLIEKKGSKKPRQTIKEIIHGLKKVNPVLILDKKSYPINRIALNEYSESTKDETISMPEEFLFSNKKYDKIAIIPIPREKYVFVIPGSSVAIDVYKTEDRIDNLVFLELEGCDLPILLKFKLVVGNGGESNLKFNSSVSDVIQMKSFLNFLEAMYNLNYFDLYDENYKKVFSFGGVVGNLPFALPYDLLNEIFSDLIYIQNLTKTRIVAPRDITNPDLDALQRIKTIIDTGKYSGEIKEFAITATKQTMLKLVETQKKKKTIEPMRVKFDYGTESLFSQEIPLGACIIETPRTKFKDSIQEVEKKLSDLDEKDLIELYLIPSNSQITRVIYPEWKTKAKE